MQKPPPFYLFFKPHEKKEKQADPKADSDHTADEYLSYLLIHLKRLNQAALCGAHALLIENTGRAR